MRIKFFLYLLHQNHQTMKYETIQTAEKPCSQREPASRFQVGENLRLLSSRSFYKLPVQTALSHTRDVATAYFNLENLVKTVYYNTGFTDKHNVSLVMQDKEGGNVSAIVSTGGKGANTTSKHWINHINNVKYGLTYCVQDNIIEPPIDL